MICLVYVPLCQNVFHGSELTILSDTLNSTKPSLQLAAVHDFIIHEDGHVLWMIELQRPEIFHFEDAF